VDEKGEVIDARSPSRTQGATLVEAIETLDDRR
jgi:hypothetical protein